MSDGKLPVKILAELSVFIALSIILKDVLPPLYRLPQGGSITAAGLVPLFWFILRRGFTYGTLAGFIYGLVHMSLGGYVINPIQGLLDYPMAYASLGIAGLFKKHPLIGVGLGIIGRFLIAFLSGIIFFTGISVEGAIASAIYNGTYLIFEFAITVAIIYLLLKRDLLKVYM